MLNRNLNLVYNFAKGAMLKVAEDKKKYEAFLQKMKQSFGDMEITTLKELVKNISLSPSVRSGDKNKLDPHINYYEVGLRDIDDQSLITIEQCKNKKLGPANPYLIEKYALKENDLLLPYRASRTLKVARVGNGYPAPLVTNASVIRIEMYEGTSKDLALLIQAYLSIHYVQMYILPARNRPPEPPTSRELISTKRLADLPIPKFTNELVENKNFSDFYLQRLEIENKLLDLVRNSKYLLSCIAKDEEETINLFLHHKEKLPELQRNESNILGKLKELLNEFVLLEEECDKPKKFPYYS